MRFPSYLNFVSNFVMQLSMTAVVIVSISSSLSAQSSWGDNPSSTPYPVAIGHDSNGGWMLRVHGNETTAPGLYVLGYTALRGGVNIGGNSDIGHGNLRVAGTTSALGDIQMYGKELFLRDHGAQSSRLRFESQSGDRSYIFSENYGLPNENRLVIQTGDDGSQDYLVLRNSHWSSGDKDVVEVLRDSVNVDASLNVSKGGSFGSSVAMSGTLSMLDLGSESARISFQSETGDRAYIFSENYGPNQNRLVIQSENDGDQDYVLFRSRHWSAGMKDTMKVHRNYVTVDGTVYAKEVKVQLPPFPDYVFQEDYELMPLEDVNAYIRKHGRLPGMPSAAEVEQDGIGIGELQTKLLEKVEELTLHMIRLENENQQLKKQLAAIHSDS